MDTDISAQRPALRVHSKAFKAQILQACDKPGASVSGIAIAHSLNPNLVQRWRRDARRGDLVLPDTPEFIPAVVASTGAVAQHRSVQAAAPLTIEIRLQRGALQARMTWPAQAAGECAAWLQALFR